MIGVPYVLSLSSSRPGPVATTGHRLSLQRRVYGGMREFLVHPLVVEQVTCRSPCCHLLHPPPFLPMFLDADL